jgi:hypothetical protein
MHHRALTLVCCVVLSFLTPAARADDIVPPSVLPAGVECPPTATEVLIEPAPLRPSPWTATVEIGVGGGDLPGRLIPPRGFRPSRPFLFPLPSADLGGFINPRVALSYDFAPLVPGELGVAWQAFSGEGDAILLGYDPLAALVLPAIERRRRTAAEVWPALLLRATPAQNALLRSRADVNLFDVTYSAWLGSEPPPVGARAGVQLRVGVRLGTFFNDDRATAVGYEQWVSNWFAGAGPMAGLTGELPIGWAFMGRQQALFLGVDGGVLFGRTEQTFRETDLISLYPAYREACVCGDRSVPFLNVEAGLKCGPNWGDRFGSRVGVRYTRYWGVGDLGASQLDFQALTVFVGLDLKF